MCSIEPIIFFFVFVSLCDVFFCLTPTQKSKTNLNRSVFLTSSSLRLSPAHPPGRACALKKKRINQIQTSANPRWSKQIESELLKTAHVVELKLDDELHTLNKLDADDLEEVRRKRLEEMRGNAMHRKEYLRKEHGEVHQLFDEKEFFSKMKGEDKMVVHFYRIGSEPCKVMTKHLKLLAFLHLETLFCEIDAEKSPYLSENLKIFMLPTLALISKEKVMDYIVGMDDFGGGGANFPTRNIKLVLQSKGMLNEEGERKDAFLRSKNGDVDEKKSQDVLSDKVRNIRQGGQKFLDSDDENSDFD